MKIVKLSVLFILLILTSCTSQKEILNSWMGSSKQEIIQSWGPPSSITSDGGNGEVLIWSKPIYINGNVFYKYTMMYVNSSGKIYHWRYETKSVPPTRIDMKVY